MGKNTNKLNNCFIVTPIGDNNSITRRAAEGVIDAAIIPALNEVGIEKSNISVAHRINELGSINNQIIEKIVESDIVIANLTGLNPNVMYELGVRHSAMKPVITICEKNQKLPFDVTEERTLFYDNDMLGVIELKDRLINLLNNDNLKVDNPVTRGVRATKLLDTDKVEGINKIDFILEKMLRLEEKISDGYYGESRASEKYNGSRLGSLINSYKSNNILVLEFIGDEGESISENTIKSIINIVTNTLKLFFFEVTIVKVDRKKEVLIIYVEASIVRENHYFNEIDVMKEIGQRLPGNISLLSV